MPDDRYEALRAALPGATPGPWLTVDMHGRGATTVVTADDDPICHALEEDAAYIAEANPATVRALLDERDAWRALGREQIDACPVPEDEGCDFCARIAALLGEDAS